MTTAQDMTRVLGNPVRDYLDKLLMNVVYPINDKIQPSINDLVELKQLHQKLSPFHRRFCMKQGYNIVRGDRGADKLNHIEEFLNQN